MKNKLQSVGPTVLQQNDTPTEINLPGDGNTLIAHADNVKNEYKTMILVNSLPNGMYQNTPMQVTLNLDYYNLIVVAGDELDGTGHVMVDKDRAITESTSDDLKEKYAALTPEAIAEIKMFPTIIATENHSYGKTDDNHYAHYGIITDVKVQDNGIKVYYQLLNAIPQQKLNELIYELGLQGNTNFNELNRMHWAIKRINMVEVLGENGIPLFRM